MPMKQMIVNRLTGIILTLALPMSTFAASGAPGWLQERMYASGKINTVVMVVAVVLIGIAIWMLLLDRRLAKLEKRYKERN